VKHFLMLEETGVGDSLQPGYLIEGSLIHDTYHFSKIFEKPP
jgi:hypothetical protein